VIPGSISPDGSARLAARHPAAAAQHFYRVTQGCLVSTLGIGTYLGEMDDSTDTAYTAAIRRSVEGGLNVVDTAINYRHMRSELSVGAALRELIHHGEAARDELLICSKAGFLTPGAIPAGALQAGDVVANMHCMAPDFLAHQLDRSLRNLDLETIDVFYLHNPETQLRFTTPEQFDERLRQAFLRLESLCAQGKIRWYGTATWGGYRHKPGQPERLDLPRVLGLARQAGGEHHHLRFIQLPVNLMMPEAYTLPHAGQDSEPANVLEVAGRAGVTVVASAALMQARLASGLTPELRQRFAGPATDAQFALQFARSTPGVCTALVGMSRQDHAVENLGLKNFPPAPAGDFVSLFRREA
jgi:aryl-alcohol dehydrogenase-like predicted oxidoreductase